jgi:protease-4
MTHRPNPVARLWSGFWNLVTWLRVATLNLLFLVIVLLILVAVLSPAHLPIPEEGPLVIAPSGYLVDQMSYKSPSRLLLGSSSERPTETLVRDLVLSIEAATVDPDIKALILDLDYLVGGALSKLEEVGQALQTFKATDKPIIAYSDNYTQAQYYLASYADEIYLNTMGSVLISGFSMYQHYMKEGIDKLNIDVHVFRVGEYKDFVEPFTRNSMSMVSREHNTQWINELWGVYTSRVETSRQLPPGAVDNFVNNMGTHLAEAGGDNARMALDYGLVDNLVSRVAMQDLLTARFGANDQGDSFKEIPQQYYLAQQRLLQSQKPDRVGLIVASGSIADGEQPAGNIGSDTLTRLIRDARENDAIKALVLRVDSGGGSAFASEIIRQELAAVRAQGKPVVISMGSLAASGGYWISIPADQIWATPTTITGSIGVFGIFPTFEQTLSRLGIHVDGIATTELAGADRLDRPLPPQAAQLAQASVEAIYQRFIGLVAEAREKTPQEVHEVAQGRVWTGATAAELGLVDELGYLKDAIAAAAGIAGIEDYSVELVEQQLTPSEQIIRVIRGEVRSLATSAQSHALGNLLSGGSVDTTNSSFTTGLLAEQAALARFYQQIHTSLTPLISAKRNGIYAQCMQCGRL